MMYLLFGIVVALVMTAGIYILLSIRVLLVGTGFTSVKDMILIILIVSVSVTLAVWLGPIAWVGVGLA